MLAAYQAWCLPAAWYAWRAGLPDFYPGEHRGTLLGHITELALCLAIPLPGAMQAAREWRRAERIALYGTGATLMAVTVAALVLNVSQ